MRLLVVLLLIAAFGILALFLKPIIQPETVRGPRPASFSSSRVQAVTSGPGQGASSHDPDSLKDRPRHAEGPSGPLCDAEFAGDVAKKLRLPDGEVIREGGRGGGWTWVNVWAVWCKPCKEEMPMLSSWFSGLRARGGKLRVLFLSVDDDERQLARFMKSDGKALKGDFLWVRDEQERTKFYRSLGLDASTTLPVHAIMDPSGRLRCVRVGSVTGTDLVKFERKFGF